VAAFRGWGGSLDAVLTAFSIVCVKPMLPHRTSPFLTCGLTYSIFSKNTDMKEKTIVDIADRFRRQKIMKPIFFAVVVVLGISSITFGQYKKGSVEDKLIRLDKAWTFAELKGDKKAAGALIAADYVGTTQQGEVENKKQYLASVVPNADMVRSDDYQIRIIGNMAIMTHRAAVEGVRNIKFRSTHIWMKRGGKWLIVSHHGSRVIPPDE
jgi:hypothetical protein